MKGLLAMLGALGVRINPEEIGQFIEQARVSVPAFLAATQVRLEAFDMRLQAIEREIAAQRVHHEALEQWARETTLTLERIEQCLTIPK